jgi:hypothetical protein
MDGTGGAILDQPFQRSEEQKRPQVSVFFCGWLSRRRHKGEPASKHENAIYSFPLEGEGRG